VFRRHRNRIAAQARGPRGERSEVHRRYFWFFFSSFSSILGIVVTLLIPACAFLVAKRLQSGRTWAAIAVAIALALYAVAHLIIWPAKGKAAPQYNPFVLITFFVPSYFLARGLIAFVIYRMRARATPDDPLALNPLAQDLRIRKRPKFINKWNIAAYGFLILSTLPLFLAWLQLGQTFHYYTDETEMAATVIGAAMLYLAVIVLGTHIYRRARRAAMLPGSGLVKQDKRSIVLYLRSFLDDSRIKLWARAANGRVLPERLVRIPFEEVVTDHLWGYGPVLAIGNPRTKSKAAPLGAARDYVDDSAWQQKVMESIHEAAMIVVVAGGTHGLAWEIDTIARLGALWKLVLLLPPVGIKELQARCEVLASHAGNDVLPGQVDFTRTRAVIYPKGKAALVMGEKGNDWTYEAALEEAALVIANERDSLDPQARSPAALSGAERRRRMLGQATSDLATMTTGALLVALMVTAGIVSLLREVSTRPFAAPGSTREKFIAEIMQECREVNADLPADQLATVCTCLANGLADVLTLQEFRHPPFKIETVENACYEKTRGR
jgi:hypothetical protein